VDYHYAILRGSLVVSLLFDFMLLG